jgi:hypothetical protein
VYRKPTGEYQDTFFSENNVNFSQASKEEDCSYLSFVTALPSAQFFSGLKLWSMDT